MDDNFKKFLYSAAGYANAAADKMKEKVEEFVEQGKMTEKEGRKTMDEFFEDFDTKKDQYEEKIKGWVENTFQKFDFPTRKEVNDLKERIADLEAKLKNQ